MTHLWQSRLVRSLVVLNFLFVAACASSNTASGPSPSATPALLSGPGPVYYDFGDILIPSELQIDRKASFVHHSGGTTAGLLVLRGQVEPKSLLSFFENNMHKDNWRLQGTIKSAENMMLFRKDARWCMIHVKEKLFKTHVQIWVLPATEDQPSGLLR